MKHFFVLFFIVASYNISLRANNPDLQITLPDGRILAYAEYGQPNGEPVFYFHGGQESRLSSGFMDSTAKSLNVRLIAPDRPGVGNSTYQLNREFINYSSDIQALADSLGIDTFSVFGLSGGAPHVLACVVGIPDRLNRVSIVSGATPYDYKGTLKGMWFPVKLIHKFASMKSDWFLRKFLESDHKALSEHPDKKLKQFQKYLPKPDKELLTAQPEYGMEFIEGSVESYKQGMDGVVQEWRLYVRDWNMNLDTIEKPITLWYGSEDKMAPKYRGEYYQSRLKNSRLHLIPNEAHFSLIRNHLKAILTELTGVNQP